VISNIFYGFFECTFQTPEQKYSSYQSGAAFTQKVVTSCSNLLFDVSDLVILKIMITV